MDGRQAKISFVYAFCGALIGWAALVIQLYILLQTLPIAAALVKYFSYFTILTNVLVTLSFTAAIVKQSLIGRLFTSPPVAAAIAMYILVVGIIYSLLLRKIWNPQGLQLLADHLLHDIVPVLFMLYWLLFVPKNGLAWKHAFIWLIYPFLYLMYTLIMGIVNHSYPYPFINLSMLTISQFITNVLLLLVVFLVLGLLFVGVGRLDMRWKNNNR